MKKLFLLETRTAFILLMFTSMSAPLGAFEVVEPTIFTKPRQSSTHQGVMNRLVDNGLEKEVAQAKALALLGTTADQTLHTLCDHPDLAIPHQALHEALAKRALYDKPLDLHDYDMLTGLVQSIKGSHLSTEQRQAIRDIVAAHPHLA